MVIISSDKFRRNQFCFNITIENNSFSISTLGHKNSQDGEELLNELNKLLELRCANNFELHVKEFEKRGTRIEIEDNGYILAGFDHFKNETLSELKRVKYRDLDDLVKRLQLTFDGIIIILDVKYIAGSTKGYSLPPGIYKMSDINSMLKSLLPGKFKKKHYNC